MILPLANGWTVTLKKMAGIEGVFVTATETGTDNPPMEIGGCGWAVQLVDLLREAAELEPPKLPAS